MQHTRFNAVAALLFILVSLSACRSKSHDTTKGGSVLYSEPSIAANSFFIGHYDFYYEDPTVCKTLLTPRFFQILKHHYDTLAITGQIGALDCDPWTNAQEGDVSGPLCFKTLKNHNSEATVQFQYRFALRSKSTVSQSVLMKFQRTSLNAQWRLADLVMPNNESLVDLLERNR
jgi:hypothetical protein